MGARTPSCSSEILVDVYEFVQIECEEAESFEGLFVGDVVFVLHRLDVLDALFDFLVTYGSADDDFEGALYLVAEVVSGFLLDALCENYCLFIDECAVEHAE